MKNQIAFLTLFILLCFSSLRAQVSQEWVARYTGSGNINDVANSVAVDNTGNVYVTGYSLGSGTGNDYVTIKYDLNGDSLWVRRYNRFGNSNDQAISIAVDNSGNVYVTGFSIVTGTDYDYVTIKYNSNGDSLWVKRYNGTGNDDDTPVSLKIDGSGNVYVTGYSISIGAGYDYATIKYNSNGDSLWVRKYNGAANTSDLATSLAVDGSGNVYVTGNSDGNGLDPDYATIKYNSNGDVLWVRRYEAGIQAFDIPSAIAVDVSGNVYVTGYSFGDGTNKDCATIKYNSNGDSLWVRRYNGPANNSDQATSIGVDTSGNVYITGYSNNNGAYFVTIKYSSSGIQQWVKNYSGGDEANPMLIKLDRAGNVYITSTTYGAGSANYFTVKCNPDGDTLWTQRYNGPGDITDFATAMAIDLAGNVYVTGRSYGIPANNFDYATIKYAERGPQPTYELTVKNIDLVSINFPDDAVEFDIYLMHTNPLITDFEYEAGQYMLSFNPRVFTNPIPLDPNDTSLMSYKIIGSDLPLSMQPINPTIRTVTNPPDTVLSLQANASPGVGNGYIINDTSPGTKIVRMRLWNKTGTFNVDSLRLKWRNPPIVDAGLPDVTNIFAYAITVSVNITTPVTHFIESGILLPIELASFNSSVNRNDITLNWTTVTETNNSRFDIERSSAAGGVNGQWSMIGFVQGNGTTSSTKNYFFTDKGLNSGKYNYRLKQIDFNGNFEYFNLSNEVIIGVPEKFDLSQNYPNPFNPTTKINYALPFDGKVNLKLFDMSGREVMTLINEVQAAGYYTVTFNGANLSSGVYFYRLNSESNEQSDNSVFVETKRMTLIK